MHDLWLISKALMHAVIITIGVIRPYFKIWTCFCKSSTNKKGRQLVHPKAGDFLLVKRKPLKQCKMTSYNLQRGNGDDECKGSEGRKVM